MSNVRPDLWVSKVVNLIVGSVVRHHRAGRNFRYTSHGAFLPFGWRIIGVRQLALLRVKILYAPLE